MATRKRCVCGKVKFDDHDAALSAAIRNAARYKPHRVYQCTVDPRFWHTTTEWNRYDRSPQRGTPPGPTGV